MSVSVIIPHFGEAALLNSCLDALWRSHDRTDVELIVVDNNERNRGFAAGCNEGVRRSHGDVVVLVNNDTEPHSGWLDPLVEALAEDGVGIAGSKLLYPDGRVQHAGVDLYWVGDTLTAGHADAALADVRRDVPAVTGACLAVRREVWDAVGGLDEGYWNGYEDVDFCLTAGQLGWRVVYEPASVLLHHESASGPERWTGVHQNIARLQLKWAPHFQGAPVG